MPAAMLKIHPARDAQLAALAAKRGTTKTAAFDYLINAAIQAGDLPDVLPGFEAVAAGFDRVTVTIEGDTLPPLSARTARGLADLIVYLATSSTGAGPNLGLELHNGGKLDVARLANGVALRFSDARGKVGKSATLTPTMAADFSRALTTAAHFAIAPAA